MRLIILKLAFILLSPFQAVSQVPSSIQTSDLKPGRELFLLYTIKPGVYGSPIFLERQLSLKNDTLIVVQKYFQESVIDIDSSWLRASDLKPLIYKANIPSEGKHENFIFGAKNISGSVFQNGLLQKKFDFNDSLYLNAVADLELVKSLAIKVGRSFSVRLYNPGKSFININYSVVRKEKVKLLGGIAEVNCYVVETVGSFVPTTLWIDVNSKSLIVQKSLLKNGMMLVKQRISLGD